VSEYKTYSVEWGCDIDALSPEHAAVIARDMLMDPHNTASFFTVTDGSGESHVVDAMDHEHVEFEEEFDEEEEI
jgi:hypothetical protein